MRQTILWFLLVVLSFAGGPPVGAQSDAEAIRAEVWTVRFEQAWGMSGTYLSDPKLADAEQGSLELYLRAAAELQRAYSRPGGFVVTRWQKLESDAALPQPLRREIELRRTLLEAWNGPATRDAEKCQEQLETLNDVLLTFRKYKNGETSAVTMQSLDQAGLLDQLRRCPADGDYRVTRTDEPPRCSKGGAHGHRALRELEALRRTEAAQWLAGKDETPPVLAVKARLAESTSASLALLDRAIVAWPDAPGLRIERMAHLAAAGLVSGMEQDIAAVIDHYPAGPLLYEIDLATSRGLVGADAVFRAQLLTILADRRPDLLGPQLRALQALATIGAREEAARVFQRLIDANPNFVQVFSSPPPSTGS